jgi:hypothetical protein
MRDKDIELWDLADEWSTPYRKPVKVEVKEVIFNPMMPWRYVTDEEGHIRKVNIKK